jgi:hypothetical protein
MINTHSLRAGSAPAVLVMALALIVTGCPSKTESTNKSEPLTSSTGGSGSGGSGGTTGSGGSTPNAAGVVSSFDPPNSLVRGYAYDPDNTNISFFVELWLNGPRPGGTPLGQLQANTVRFLFPSGPYGFSYTVPMAYQDGKLRQIYAYAIDPNTGARNELGNSPMGFWAGENTAGKAFFNTNVLPVLNANCTSCHTVGDYIAEKFQLAAPTKFGGGTATNNELINRALGQAHGGGNRCGTPAGTPCAQFQQWWAMEFN